MAKVKFSVDAVESVFHKNKLDDENDGSGPAEMVSLFVCLFVYLFVCSFLLLLLLLICLLFHVYCFLICVYMWGLFFTSIKKIVFRL